MICRPTQQEAEDYYRHAIIENADWGAIDGMLALTRTSRRRPFRRRSTCKQRQYFAANAIGGYPFVGTPDRVAAGAFATISQAGMRGIAVSFVNYLDELPYFCDEVLPRLVRLGRARRIDPSAPSPSGPHHSSALNLRRTPQPLSVASMSAATKWRALSTSYP